MKEMAQYSLLTEEEEIDIVKDLEENETKIMKDIIKSPFFINYLANLFKVKYKKNNYKEGGNLKSFLYKKILKAVEEDNYLALKRDFKIPRSDILKISQKIVQSSKIEENDKTELQYAIKRVEDLQEKLIISNLRLVLSIAKKYARKKSNNLFDLIQEGNMGLIKAVEMFYYHKGVRFAAYAKWWIKQSIIRSLYENNRHIKVPLHFIDAVKRLEDFVNNYIQENHEYPSIEKMIEKTTFSKKKIMRIMQLMSKPVSLDTPVFYKDGIVELKDAVKDGNHKEPYYELFRNTLSFTIKKMLSGLSDRERDILVKRYGLEDGVQRTLDEVGYYFNLTRERIRQIEKKSLDKLKTPSKVFMFKKLLEGEGT